MSSERFTVPRNLCAVCVYNLTLPTAHVFIDGASIGRRPGFDLIRLVARAVLEGHQVVINQRTTGVIASTFVGGTAVCVGCFHFVINDPTNQHGGWS